MSGFALHHVYQRQYNGVVKRSGPVFSKAQGCVGSLCQVFLIELLPVVFLRGNPMIPATLVLPMGSQVLTSSTPPLRKEDILHVCKQSNFLEVNDLYSLNKNINLLQLSQIRHRFRRDAYFLDVRNAKNSQCIFYTFNHTKKWTV